MTKTSRKCYQCREPTAVERIGPVTGAETPLTVTLRELPVLVCEHGHRQFVHARLALQRLLQAADVSVGELPISQEKGFWFKRAVCVDCGAPVARRRGETQSFHFEVPLDEDASFCIELALPLFRCRACGKDQARSRSQVQGRAPTALLRALRAAGVVQG